MFLLDTTVISELGRPSGKVAPRVAAWSASTPQAVVICRSSERPET
jgi:hypothetical protein